MTAATATPVRQVGMNEIDQLLQRAKGTLSDEECELLRNMALSYFKLGELLERKDATIGKLRKALFGASSEKLKDLTKDSGDKPKPAEPASPQNAGDPKPAEASAATDGSQQDTPPPPTKPPGPKPGHGRNGVDKYEGAERIEIAHDSVKGGDACIEGGCKGRIYPLAEPTYLVRVTGQSPILASVYELERLRCNLCGTLYKAKAPEGIGEEKYDASAASMIGLLRYGRGFPFYRLAGLQESLGIPLPTSTQWDIMAECAPKLMPAFTELVRQGAQGDLVHNDDTKVRILELRRAQEAGTADADEARDEAKASRTGVFTTGIIAITEGRRIALFFSGRQHAGENLRDVLLLRAENLAAPILMCDGLTRNLPKELAVILANCLAHARRKFAEVIERFPAECEHVLMELALVYKNDAKCKELGFTANQRLLDHQANSGPVIGRLHTWLHAEIDERRVEPNSGLGQAIRYLTKRWEQMTLFLRVAGAPLDNNIVEQGLKRAILHRKNSLFYQTQNGAKVGDVFMSLIHTAELARENPFEYLTALQQNADAVMASPAAWMPWSFRESLASLGTG